MLKGWRLEIVTGSPEVAQVFVAALSDQTEAIRRVVAGRRIRGIATYPVDEREFVALGLAVGEVRELPDDRWT
jgi:hypothetical protein